MERKAKMPVNIEKEQTDFAVFFRAGGGLKAGDPRCF
jgi:hypothetical protein